MYLAAIFIGENVVTILQGNDCLLIFISPDNPTLICESLMVGTKVNFNKTIGAGQQFKINLSSVFNRI